VTSVTSRFDTADIKRYYDRHSASFVRFGQGRASIHRAVWGPGTRTREDAFHYVDEQVAVAVRRFGSPSRDVHVVDLGCGVGASLCYLAERLPIRGTGITLSPAQAAGARQVVAAAGLSQRVECIEGDYCDMPATLTPADVAYAIESFVHGPSPERFFNECRRLIKPGGLLIVCDDVRRNTTLPEAARRIEEFASGWHINTLLDRDTLVTMARAAGFEHESTTDLTPFLEINRVRDRAIAAGLTFLKWLPVTVTRFDYAVGGTALQACLASGWIGYELSVFRAGSG
jgi:cyclopropane fatty-acyl-phospholipid synthase-like methyltransferase